MPIVRQCDFCSGNHTEVKCPNLDGYIRHLNAVVRSKSPSKTNLTDEDYKDNYTGLIFPTFWRVASVQDRLNFASWTWATIIRSYTKKLRYRAAGLKRRGVKRKKIVNCGYCHGKGHTRRKCDRMKEDITIADDMAKIQRAMFLNACKSIGMGVGAILRFDWTSETEEYAAYHSDLPRSVMAMVTSIPVADINPFISLARWDELFHDAYFGIKFINPSGRFLKSPETKLNVANGLLSDAFNELGFEQRGTTTLNRQYNATIIAPSSNFEYSIDTENDYKKNTFKKYDVGVLEGHTGRMLTWLKEQS